MLGESMTARNNSSWWMSIYLLPRVMVAQMRRQRRCLRTAIFQSETLPIRQTDPSDFAASGTNCGFAAQTHRGNSTKKRMVLLRGFSFPGEGRGCRTQLCCSTVSRAAIQRMQINHENYGCQSDCLQSGTQLCNAEDYNGRWDLRPR